MLAILLCPGVLSAAEPSARQLYKQARKAEKAGDIPQAYLLYAQAAAKDPERREYWVRAEALRTRASRLTNVMPVFSTSFSGSPTGELPLPEPSAEELAETRKPQAPFELRAAPGHHDFDLRGDAKSLFEQIGKQYGLEVVFDGDYPSGPSMRFRITGADYQHALYALMTMTSSFIVPIGEKVFMVVKDTEQKRREVETHIAVSIPIPAAVTVQEAQELARSVQQLMEIQKFAIDSTQRLVIMRDRASKVRPAQAILQQLMLLKPEISMEVELISLNKTTSLGIGLDLPTEFPIISLADVGRHLVQPPSGFLNFFTFGGGFTYLGLGVASSQLLATWSRSSGQSVLKAEIRAMDGQAANFHAGDKYPLQTMGFFGVVTPGEEVYRPPPTFNFEDLGLVLKITPKIHDSREVTLEVEAEFKMLGSTSFNGIPVIGNRKFVTRVRLGFDQTAVIAGLVNGSRSTARTGFIPLIGRVTKDQDENELVLTIKPKLLSVPPTEIATKPIFIGAESRLLTPM